MSKSLARAKLNLNLRVTGRRCDGYHLINSLVGFCVFGDPMEITLNRTKDQIVIDGPFAEDIKDENIIFRALNIFRNETSWNKTVTIKLTKNIPVCAGLGGGSSNAATTLHLLAKVSSFPLSKIEKIHEIALVLGADVPVCLNKKTSLIRGIGEKLTPVGRLPKLPILLVNPGVPLRSRDVFQNYRGLFSEPISLPKMSNTWTSDQLITLLGKRPQNDLCEAAISLVPELESVLEKLDSLPGVASVGMSGSGTTCFAIFPHCRPPNIEHSLKLIRETGWWFKLTNLCS